MLIKTLSIKRVFKERLKVAGDIQTPEVEILRCHKKNSAISENEVTFFWKFRQRMSTAVTCVQLNTRCEMTSQNLRSQNYRHNIT